LFQNRFHDNFPIVELLFNSELVDWIDYFVDLRQKGVSLRPYHGSNRLMNVMISMDPGEKKIYEFYMMEQLESKLR